MPYSIEELGTPLCLAALCAAREIGLRPDAAKILAAIGAAADGGGGVEACVSIEGLAKAEGLSVEATAAAIGTLRRLALVEADNLAYAGPDQEAPVRVTGLEQWRPEAILARAAGFAA